MAHAKPIHLDSEKLNPGEVQGGQVSASNIPSSDKRIVQFNGSLAEERKDRLKDRGISFLSYIPEDAWIVDAEPSKINKLKKRKFVKSVLPFKARYKISDRLKGQIKSRETRILVKFFRDVPSPEQREEIRRFGKILERMGENRLEARIPGRSIDELAEVGSVRNLKPDLPPVVTLNDDSRSLIDVDRLWDRRPNLTGEGLTAAIWDGGWAARHTDLNQSGKLVRGDAGCTEDNCQVSDHATHVAGTMAGLGELQSDYKGVSPDSRVITYEWPSGSSSELFQETDEAINLYDSVVSQNSWGYGIGSSYKYLMGDYTGSSRDYDEIISNSTSEVSGTLSVVFAAGNEGRKWSFRYNTTTGPGATAKNTITVGAVDDSGDMTSYSSWGPTDDGRIKPDLVANGGCGGETGIKSTLPGNNYGSKCGTSMAAPAVSGTVLLLNERFNETIGRLPEPATSKAVLIHTAEDPGRKGPDYKYGWGLVNASAASQLIGKAEEQDLIRTGSLSTGEKDTYSIDVPENESIKMTLVWSDYPASTSAGKKLVNDLDLVVRDSGGVRHYPWTLNWSTRTEPATRDKEDHRNNVEQVYIDETTTNELNITVDGYNIPEGPQDYTLILTEKKGQIPPEISVESPVNTTYGETPLMNITSDKELGEAVFSVDGEPNSTLERRSDKNFLNESVNLASGSHTVKFYARNIFDIWGKEEVEFTVDRKPPDIEPLKPVNNSNISENLSIKANWYEEETYVSDHSYTLEGPEKITGVLNDSLNTSELQEGQYKVIFNASDPVGNYNTSSRTLTIDKSPPDLHTTSPEQNFLTGKVEINASFSDEVTAVESSFYVLRNESFELERDLNDTLNVSSFEDGNYSLIYTANDSAGNEINTTSEVRIDNTPPEVKIESPENGTVSREVEINASWEDSSGLENLTYELVKDSEAVEAGSANDTINSSLLEDGNYTLRFTAEDLAGNVNTVKKNISIQNPPIINISEPGRDIYSSMPDVNLTSNEALSVSLIEINGSNRTLQNSSQKRFYREKLDLTEGDFSPTIYGEDLSGNLEKIKLNLTFENSSPQNLSVKALSEPDFKDWYRSNATFNVSCKDKLTEVENIEVETNRTTVLESNKSQTEVKLDRHGKNIYRFSCTDAAFNKRNRTEKISIDSSKPSITGLEPRNSSEVSSEATFKAEFSDGSQGSGINLSSSNKSVINAETGEAVRKNSSLAFNLTSVDKGEEVRINVSVEDNTGNRKKFKFLYETPEPPEDSISEDDTENEEESSGGGFSTSTATSLDTRTEEKEEEEESKDQDAEEGSTLSIENGSKEVENSTAVEKLESSEETEVKLTEPDYSPEPPEETEIYTELNLSATEDEKVDVNLTFSVNKSWFHEEELEPERTALYRQNDTEWQKLETDLVDETENEFVFESKVPGFSIFVIAAENRAVNETRGTKNTDKTGNKTSERGNQTTKTLWPGKEDFQNLRLLLLGLFMTAVPVIGYELSEHREKEKLLDKIEERKEEQTDEKIKSMLIEAEISLQQGDIEDVKEKLKEVNNKKEAKDR